MHNAFGVDIVELHGSSQQRFTGLSIRPTNIKTHLHAHRATPASSTDPTQQSRHHVVDSGKNGRGDTGVDTDSAGVNMNKMRYMSMTATNDFIHKPGTCGSGKGSTR
jgi:hypothetical protein